MPSASSVKHSNADGVAETELGYRLRQQTLMAEFGLHAVRSTDIDSLLQCAAELCAQGMNTGFAKALEWLPQENRLLVRAGVGWSEGVVGKATISADPECPAGFVVHTGQPVITNHLAPETRFRTPRLLLEHGVKRAINVIVRGHEKGQPFGVLAVDSPFEGRFDEADIAFMQGFANLLGVAIERIRIKEERDSATARLHVERDRLRAVLDALPVGVFIADETGGIVESNAFMAKIWSGSAQAPAPAPAPSDLADYGRYKAWWTDTGHPLSAEDWALARAIRHGEISVGEMVDIERFDGTRGTILKSAAPVRDAEGRIVGGVVAVKDITERRQIEAALRESRERLRLIIESVQDYAIFTMDTEGRITSWNAGAEAVFGWPEAAIIGQPAAVLFAPEDREARIPEQELATAFNDGRAAAERWLLRKDGNRIFANETVRPLHDAAGRVRGAVKVSRDETERRKTEDALRRSEENFRTLANSIPQLAWIANAEGWIYWYNDRWFAYTGTTLEEVEGWGWRKLHHPEHVDRVVARLTHAWQTGEPWQDTFPLRGKDGTYRWFLSRALPIRDRDGRIVRWFGTNTDVTEQREAEERQALLVREISHRVKNSLALVASLLRLQARGTRHEEVRRAVEDAQTRIATIAKVHDHLWQHSEVTNVDLAEFLAGLCDGLQSTAPSHRLVYQADEAVPVSVDRAIPIGLLVNELVTNAFKYAYPAATGGEVRVTLSRPNFRCIRLEVADRGRGLPADFDLHRPTGSLGVRIIDAVTRQLGCRLQALSGEPGARFVVDMHEKEHETSERNGRS